MVIQMNHFFEDLKKPIILFGIIIAFMAVLICVNVNKKKDQTEEIAEDIVENTIQEEIKQPEEQEEVLEEEILTGRVDDDGITLLYDNSYGKEYLQNCVFLGDSRIVGMALYGFIETNTALAQIGLTHNNAMNTVYKTSTGKEYTIESYLQTHQPKVIYICYGVNGLTQGEKNYKDAYQKLVERVKMLAPGSYIVIQSIWPAKDGGIYANTVSNSKIDYYNDFLYDLAAEEGFYYLDIQGALKDEEGQMMHQYDGGDGLHYNQAGYADIIDYIVTHPVPGVVPEPNGYEKETFVWKNTMGNGAPDSSSVGKGKKDGSVSDDSVSGNSSGVGGSTFGSEDDTTDDTDLEDSEQGDLLENSDNSEQTGDMPEGSDGTGEVSDSSENSDIDMEADDASKDSKDVETTDGLAEGSDNAGDTGDLKDNSSAEVSSDAE